MSDNSDLIRTFVDESYDLLDDVEPRLIELQQMFEDSEDPDPEVLNSIFRMFHTLKGSAGFLELNNLQSVTHEAETLLDYYRSGKLTPIPRHIQLLLQTIDFVRMVLNNIESYMHDQGFESEAQDIIQDLSAISKTGFDSTARTPKQEKKKPQKKKVGKKETSGDASSGDEAEAKQLTALSSELADEDIIPLDQLITPEMTDQFTKEAQDLLDGLEEDIIKAEDNLENMDIIEKAFRKLHTFKGNCGLLGFNDLELLGHKLEEYLDGMRLLEIPITVQNLELILNYVDTFRTTVSNISKGASPDIKFCDKLIDFLDEEINHSQREMAGQNGISLPEDNKLSSDTSVSDEDSAKTAQKKSTGGSKGSAGTGKEEEKEEKKQVKSSDEPIENGGGPNNKLSDKAGPMGQSTVRKDIRIDVEKVDKLVDLVGELSLAEMMVVNNPDIDGMELENFERAAHQLRRIVSEIQYVSMSLRMIPISGTFKKMVRLVHDLSQKCGKKVRLVTRGEDTEVDKSVIDWIGDPLVHVMRNAIDHGIESTEEREKLGKPEMATVTIEARHESGEVWISITDDGRGLERNKIIGKAQKTGLLKDDGRDLNDEDVWKLIMEPGFSTADRVSNISGRGVGMDVVKRNLEKINGKVDIMSWPGRGSTFIFKIPLTLALMDGMVVKVGKARYIIPLISIRESIRPESDMITVTMDGQEIVSLRNELIPVLRLHQLQNIEPDAEHLEDGLLIIIEHRGKSFAIAVDTITGQQQTVIKGLSDYMGNVRGVSGCTILGDGQVSLIIDVGTLIDVFIEQDSLIENVADMNIETEKEEKVSK